MNNLFGGAYAGRRVFLTGHTGFKGSWLALWLKSMGAHVFGYSLPPDTQPNHYDLLGLDVAQQMGDIRDYPKLELAMCDFEPEVVFHLAAQPLVRASYRDPLATYACNVMGTAHVLEAMRHTPSVKAGVVITTDKCYENVETLRGYREDDPLGGHDPYSASKACAEVVTSSYARSFFRPEQGGALVASCRAGNVVGGGDWAADRLVPDMVRAAVAGQDVVIRNPDSIRPWQHVLEPLSGYLLLGARLLAQDVSAVGAWNFGPTDGATVPVRALVEVAKAEWSRVSVSWETTKGPHEAGVLCLDCTKARTRLNWQPVWDDITLCMQRTMEWYRRFAEGGDVLSWQQLEGYVADARRIGVAWA